MKRDEMEALIQNAVNEMRMSAGGKTSVLHLPPNDMAKLFELAVLGASVAAPTSVEQRQMATALKAQADKEALDDEWRVSITFAERLARAAILTLKDRANV